MATAPIKFSFKVTDGGQILGHLGVPSWSVQDAEHKA
jgi:hypothetical protein